MCICCWILIGLGCLYAVAIGAFALIVWTDPERRP